MLKAVLMAATLAAAGVAHAQSTPAKKELVAKILQQRQSGLEVLARSLVEQPALQVMQAAGNALQRLPAERREAVGRDIEADVRKYVEEATPIVRDRAIKLAPSTIGAVLEEELSEDELKQVLAILDSAAFRKFQMLDPKLQRAIGEKLVTETRAEVEPKVRALEQSVSKRLGLTPAPAGSAAKAGAATPAAPAKK